MTPKPGGERVLDFCPNRPFSNCLWVPLPTDAAIGLYDGFFSDHLPYRVSPDLAGLVQVNPYDAMGWPGASWVAAAAHLFRDHVEDYRVVTFCRAAVDPKLMQI